MSEAPTANVPTQLNTKLQHIDTSESTDLKAVVGPLAELHRATLIVEWEVGDVDLAGTAQLGGRRPEHVTVVSNHRLALHEPHRKVVRTACATVSTRPYDTSV